MIVTLCGCLQSHEGLPVPRAAADGGLQVQQQQVRAGLRLSRRSQVHHLFSGALHRAARQSPAHHRAPRPVRQQHLRHPRTLLHQKPQAADPPAAEQQHQRGGGRRLLSAGVPAEVRPELEPDLHPD